MRPQITYRAAFGTVMGYYQAIVNAVITVTASCRLPGDFSLGYITEQTSLQTVTDIRL